MREAHISTIADYRFSNDQLLQEALSHPSLDSARSYQRLEFLGDRVIGLIIAEWLEETFPGASEGELNRRLSGLVRTEALAKKAASLGFVEALLLSPGAEREGTRQQKAVQADVCEAVLGAIYLDGGFAEVRAFVRRHWDDVIRLGPTKDRDAKTALQEIAQARAWQLPRYRVVGRDGPDHAPRFVIEVSLPEAGDTAAAQADAPSKRVGEQLAAARLLQKLETLL